ncbi:MAG: hypothetical protein NTW87_27585, partial [Planctomycetota bacterium]|nr:hypothetical protein [Planctomycetota bacterium]
MVDERRKARIARAAKEPASKRNVHIAAVVLGVGIIMFLAALAMRGDGKPSPGKSGTATTEPDAAGTVWRTDSSPDMGPAGHWAFDEGVGRTAADSSGNGNRGTLRGGPPAWVAGTVGAGALQFNGNIDYVSVPRFANDGGPVTVSFWNYVATPVKSFAFGVGVGADNRFCTHCPWEDGIVYWDYGNERGDGRISASYAGKTGKWTHVALVSTGRGGDFKAIYLDGV